MIPLYNEQDNISILCERLKNVLNDISENWEIILIDDGSTDNTRSVASKIIKENKKIKGVFLRRNYGQTSAMMAGFQYSSGDIIISMDGDLQNDPKDIPHLIKKLDEGYDVVSGWRKDRKDDKWLRVVPSRIANNLVSWLSGVRLHDHGCSLKAYRREIIQNIRLYGEMHRFIPVFAFWEGARVTEIVVNHSSRYSGTSKYGLSRIPKVLLDLIFLKLMGNYGTRPVHVFGGFGLLNILASLTSGSYAIFFKIFDDRSHMLTLLPLLASITMLVGILSILMGFVSELIVRTYYESQQKEIYSIKELINIERPH